MPHVRSIFTTVALRSKSKDAIHLVLSILFLQVSAFAGEPPAASSVSRSAAASPEMQVLDYAKLVSQPEVVRYFSEMLRQALGAGGGREEAAFVIRDGSGAIVFHPWPRSGKSKVASWRGPVPEGVIAIAHTHPSNWWSAATAHDLAEARRTRLPIFILTRAKICVADPATGKNVVVVDSARWRENATEQVRSN